MKISEWKTRSKYNARRVTYKGIKFDSQAERDYFCQLEILKRGKVVTKIELQPKFLLQFGYKREGKTIRPIYYIADFQVTYKDGHKELIDVKGYRKERVYLLKKKMFHYKYPELTIVEV